MADKTNAALAEKLVTADELLGHPEWGRCELIEGKITFMSPAGAEHGVIIIRIAAPLMSFVDQNELGEVFGAETGFILHKNPDTVRGPDVMYLAKSRLPSGGIPKGYLTVVPDLAVEVVSPGDAFSDVTEKAESYTRAGVKLVWVVDPQTQRAYIFRPTKEVSMLGADAALSGEDVLPGFSLPLKDVFRR